VELDNAVASLGGRVIGIRADASQLTDLDTVYAQLAEQSGRLDVLFANAGGRRVVGDPHRLHGLG